MPPGGHSQLSAFKRSENGATRHKRSSLLKDKNSLARPGLFKRLDRAEGLGPDLRWGSWLAFSVGYMTEKQEVALEGKNE